MASAEKSIDVHVPVSRVYNQWTQFESFPQFMEGVKSVEQIDDRRLRWRAEIAGSEENWEAEITEQVPDERIAWKSTTGSPNAGVVTFHRLSDEDTRVMLQLDYEPQGMVQRVGDMLGAVEHRVQGDLERFKEFLEAQGSETGAWRGELR